jgi:hypothetical protein
MLLPTPALTATITQVGCPGNRGLLRLLGLDQMEQPDDRFRMAALMASPSESRWSALFLRTAWRRSGVSARTLAIEAIALRSMWNDW